MEASRTRRVPVRELAAGSGVPFTGIAPWQALPTRLICPPSQTPTLKRVQAQIRNSALT